MGLVDLLLLTDGRAPIGAYAHSFGLESAVLAGDVGDVPTLQGFIAARLATSGHVEAASAAAVCHRATARSTGAAGVPGWVHDADREVDARMLAPAVRDASRALGRHLLRLARRTWPDRRLDALVTADTPNDADVWHADGLSSEPRTSPGSLPDSPRRHLDGWHQPVVLGVLAAVLGTSTVEVAVASLYGISSGIASAGVRLLGLDPIEVHAVQARLGLSIDELAAEAAALAHLPFDDLPRTGTPLVDIRAQRHADDPGGRLFTS